MALSDDIASLLAEADRALHSDPGESLKAADRAIEIAQRSGDPSGAAAAWRVRARALRALGHHADALAAFDSAAAHAQQAGNARLAAQVQIGKIDSLGLLGRYDEAIALAHRLEEELRALGAEEEAAKALVNAGSLHFRRDQYAAALDCYERALKALVGRGDPLAEARVQANCANILTLLNRVDEAVILYEKARETFSAGGMAPAAAMVDANIGYLHYVSGRHAAALASLTRARQAFEARNQTLEAAKCDADMADAYRDLNLFPEALECYERAIRVFEAIPLDYERGRAELGRAAVLVAAARQDEALAALEQADAIFRAQKNALQRAHVRLMRAYQLRSSGQNTEACAQARRATRALRRGGLGGWAAEARFLTADIALEEGRNAVRSMSAIRRAARRYARGWLECRAEHALGRHYARQGETSRALNHFRAGVAALEAARTLIAPEEMHVAFLRDKLAVYEDLVGTLLARGRRQDVAEALEYVERAKSRLLLERVQSALEGPPPSEHPAPSTESRTLNTRLSALRAELSRGYHRLHAFGQDDQHRLGRMGADTVDTLAPLEQAYRAALREVELTNRPSTPDLFALASVPPVDELQAALHPEETLVEFYVAREEVCAFTVNRRRVRAQRNLARLDAVNHAARRMRYHLQKAGMMAEYAQRHARQLQADSLASLECLYDLLLKPLEASLETEKVILIPHGPLHGLPFHAFSDGALFALDRWEIVYAPSAAVWHASRRREEMKEALPSSPPPRTHALLMGVPEPDIERVAAEIEQLARILPDARVFCAEKATLEAFHAHAGCSRLIHLATHALYRADNPLFSGLRFADGWLLARDLYEITLNSELATLSACRTGMAFVEPGDELFGLLRGFLAAGVRSVAASLWPADDAATAALMVRFYRNLARGLSRAAALRDAQRATRDHYPHPYHWAAFVLVGER